MSPSRVPYRAGRDRREVLVAALASGAVVAFTGIMLWVLSPESDDPTPIPPVVTTTVPTGSSTTVPGDTTPASSTPASTAPGSTPASSDPTTSSSAPG